MSAIRSAWAREPITLSFCALSFATLLLSLAVPRSTGQLVLSPELVLNEAHVWRLLSYALLPYGILSFLLLSTSLIWFGKYIEGWLGAVRYTALLFGAALSSALVFVALGPASTPLVGPLFVASGVGVAFSIWSVRNRSRFGWPLKAFWIIATAWVLYTLVASPLYLSGMHSAAWGVGALMGIHAVRSSAATPSNNTAHSDARASAGTHLPPSDARAGGRGR